MSTFSIMPELAKTIKHLATLPQTGVTLRQMGQFGRKPACSTMFRGALFLRDELPIRLAHRVVQLENLPSGLSDMRSIIHVKNWYAESLQELLGFPIPKLSQYLLDKYPSSNGVINCSTSPAEIKRFYYWPFNPEDLPHLPAELPQFNENFVRLIRSIKRRHDPVVTTIARGILEWKQKYPQNNVNQEVQSFLDRFFMSRVGIRCLIGQHVALHYPPVDSDYVGIICLRTNLQQIAKEAVDNARQICEDHFGLFNSPKVKLFCPKSLNFVYIPSHLHHMLFELAKNSLRAVVEHHGSCSESFPDVKIVVAEGKEDITIKVSDEGGGIPRSGMPHVWTYLYTTANSPILDPDYNDTEFRAPLAGFGYGLPISRLYARYFGGDLRLISMEGYFKDMLAVNDDFTSLDLEQTPIFI